MEATMTISHCVTGDERGAVEFMRRMYDALALTGQGFCPHTDYLRPARGLTKPLFNGLPGTFP